MSPKLEGFPKQFAENITDATKQADAEKRVEKKEDERGYNPAEVLKKRDIIPSKVRRNERGIEVIEDKELNYIFKYLRDNIKEGNLLDIGAGIAHVHQMCAIEDKLTEITAVDISPINNVLTRDLIEMHMRKTGESRVVPKSDVETLEILAEALHKDATYGISRTGDEILSSVYDKMQYKGKLDIKWADVIKNMDELKDGKMVDGRTYDNALLLFASFARTREELIGMLSAVKERLKENGRLIIMDAETYENGVDSDSEEVAQQEDTIVEKLYSEVYDWSQEDMIKVLQEIGFKIKKIDTHKISEDSESEQRSFGKRYLSFVAEK